MGPWEGETSMEGGGKETKIRVQTGLSAGHLCHLGRAHLNRTRPRQGCLRCAWLGLMAAKTLSTTRLARCYSPYRKYYLQRV